MNDTTLNCIWITIYKDTYTKQYEGDNNLMDILVEEPVVFEFYNTSKIKHYFDGYNDFLDNYVCDDVDGLFDFAYLQGAILETDIY